MKGKSSFVLLIMSMALCCMASARENLDSDYKNKLALRILYVGHPGTARATDYVSFLEKHFTQVNVANLDTFVEKTIRDCDVAIIDYSGLTIKDNTIQMPRIPFDEDYSRPIVTIGAAGALVSDYLSLKTGYL